MPERAYLNLKNIYMNVVINAKGVGDFRIRGNAFIAGPEKIFLYGIKDDTYIKGKSQEDLIKHFFDAIQS